MKQNVVVVALFSFLAFNVHGQDKFGAGYYINNNGDTLRGFIEYRYNYNYEFEYRATIGEKSRPVTIADAQEFGFTGGVAYRKLDFALGDLSQGPVFAQRLVSGGVSAYRYQGRLFVQSPNNSFQVEKETRKQCRGNQNSSKEHG